MRQLCSLEDMRHLGTLCLDLLPVCCAIVRPHCSSQEREEKQDSDYTESSVSLRLTEGKEITVRYLGSTVKRKRGERHMNNKYWGGKKKQGK